MPATTDERALVERARDGDERALAEIIRRHRTRVRALAGQCLAGNGEVDEIVHLVFIRLHRALPSLRMEASLATWLYRTTVNLCRDHGRERVHASIEHPQIAGVLANAAGTAEAVEASERSAWLNALLSELPIQWKEAVVLRYIDGLTYDEIAIVQRCPAGSVASRIHRALRRMSESLTRRGITPESL